MDFKRAAIVGAGLWVAIFFEVSALMFGFGLTGSTYYTAHYIFLGLLAGFAAIYYFMDKKSESGLKEGARAGAVFAAAGIVLDAIITVPFFVKDYAFFLKIPMLLGYLEVIAITAAVGFVKKKKM